MKRKTIWLVASCLMVLSLVAAACARAPAKEVAPAAPGLTGVAPAVKEIAPAVKEAAPGAETNMVKMTLTKLDGTTVVKTLEKPQYGGTLNTFRSGEVFGFDSIYTVQWRTHTLHMTNDKLAIGNWSRGPQGTNDASLWLSVYNRPEVMTPHLAERWEMPDSNTIIYYLRKGVRWALNPNSEASRLVNGREFTADDVVFSLKHFWETPVSYVYTNYPASERPTSVRKIDKYTVEVKNSPGMHIAKTHETTVLFVFIYPPEVIAKYGDLKDWRNSVGTGPFILEEYVAMSSITVRRNPTHFGVDPLFPQNQVPYVDRVKQVCIADASTRLAALRTGKIDYVTTDNYNDIEGLLKTNPGLKYMGRAQNAPRFLAGRLDRPELPFKDIRVRKAMAMALDYEAIIRDYWGGYAQMLHQPVQKWPDYADTYVEFKDLPADIQEIYTYNPQKARQLLAEAGYPKGFKTIIELSADYVDYALVIQGYLDAIGINAEFKVYEAGVYGAVEQGRTHKEMLWRYAAASDPFGFWETHPLKGHNAAMVNDPWINEFREKMAQMVYDEPGRRKLYKEQFVPYFYRQVYMLMPPAGYSFRIWQPWLKGYAGETNLGGAYGEAWARYVWVDQELKKAMGYK